MNREESEDVSVKVCPSPLPTHSRSNEDGNNRVFQFWVLLCQLNEQFCDQSHMTKTVRGTPAIQLVSLWEEGEGRRRGKEEEEGDGEKEEEEKEEEGEEERST